MSDVKFPFKPNETVKAAFEHDQGLAVIARVLINEMLESAVRKRLNPWDILIREHPELRKYLDREDELTLSYSHALREFNLRKRPK